MLRLAASVGALRRTRLGCLRGFSDRKSHFPANLTAYCSGLATEYKELFSLFELISRGVTSKPSIIQCLQLIEGQRLQLAEISPAVERRIQELSERLFQEKSEQVDGFSSLDLALVLETMYHLRVCRQPIQISLRALKVLNDVERIRTFEKEMTAQPPQSSNEVLFWLNCYMLAIYNKLSMVTPIIFGFLSSRIGTLRFSDVFYRSILRRMLNHRYRIALSDLFDLFMRVWAQRLDDTVGRGVTDEELEDFIVAVPAFRFVAMPIPFDLLSQTFKLLQENLSRGMPMVPVQFLMSLTKLSEKSNSMMNGSVLAIGKGIVDGMKMRGDVSRAYLCYSEAILDFRTSNNEAFFAELASRDYVYDNSIYIAKYMLMRAKTYFPQEYQQADLRSGGRISGMLADSLNAFEKEIVEKRKGAGFVASSRNFFDISESFFHCGLAFQPEYIHQGFVFDYYLPGLVEFILANRAAIPADKREVIVSYLTANPKIKIFIEVLGQIHFDPYFRCYNFETDFMSRLATHLDLVVIGLPHFSVFKHKFDENKKDGLIRLLSFDLHRKILAKKRGPLTSGPL